LAPTTLTPGTRLGSYEVVVQIGVGGMGEVYRATDTKLKRQVALKVLPPAVASDPERLARFRREAEVLAALNHPNVAAIYGLEDAGGSTALVMELVEGPTLAERITAGAIAVDEALLIAGQIAQALEVAHERGIVHRDLKPANVKVRDDGTVKVLDFGLAKAMDSTAASGATSTAAAFMNSPTITSPAMTQMGMILGTAAYMSPEQAAGRPVDKRADIWAFGVVLWEMLTGRQLFPGDTIAHILAAVLTTDPDLASVPPHVRRLMTSCLAKDPRKRLRDIGDAMGLVQDPVRVDDAARAARWPVVVGFATAGVLAIALAVVLWSGQSKAAGNTAAPPVVRFQVDRPLVDPYNNTPGAFAVSPDGRFLAYYTLGSTGRATLSLRTLATGNNREIAGSAVLLPQTPFWSADSRQLVYVTALTTQAFDLTAGKTRDLCACRFRGGAWTRDNVILLGSGLQDSGSIQRVSIDDRKAVPITTVDSAQGEQDTFPVFLPDGRRFLFTRSRPGSLPATYLGSLDGPERASPKRIADGSRTLILASSKGVGPYVLGIDAVGLVAHAFDLQTMTVAIEPIIVAPGAGAASISDNGLLATSALGNRPLTQPTWFDRTGANRGGVGESRPIQNVSLASDGKTLAVGEARGDGQGSAVQLRDLSGASRVLTFANEREDDAVWSPDGTRLVVSSPRGSTQNMFERTIDGTGQPRLLFETDRRSYANDWSRDRHWLIFTMPKDGAAAGLDLDLWVLPMDGSGPKTPVPYLATTAREAQAEFSPDGRFVAYTLTDAGGSEVYVQTFPNAADGKWLVSRGGGTEPHWSRDGKELFYFAGQTLMAARVSVQPSFSNSLPVRLFDAPVQPWYINDSDRWQVAPDGQRFLLLVPSGKNTAPPIDVVVNWATVLPGLRPGPR